jgi:segregation and condensation protein B|tara:strand:- start:50 stop:610 length:561 start_codon:yes stop_codon:yes gene_type:complete
MESKISSGTIRELDENKELENIKKIEAAFFLSARYLSLKELVLLTDINPLMLKELIEKLIQRYNNEESAIEIVTKENMWKMDVRQEYISMVNKLATGSSEFTKAEQETLAVIAYKQPVKQSIIIKIRGNKAYDHVKNFITIGLVQAKQIGHTKELKLSDDFFDYFHLQNSGNGVLDRPEDSEEDNN